MFCWLRGFWGWSGGWWLDACGGREGDFVIPGQDAGVLSILCHSACRQGSASSAEHSLYIAPTPCSALDAELCGLGDIVVEIAPLQIMLLY